MTRVASLPSDLIANNAQAQLQQIVDHTSAAMFVKDLDGRFLFVNREFERIKGMPVAAIIGSLDGDLFPAAVAELHRNDRKVVDERRAIDFEEIVETAQGPGPTCRTSSRCSTPPDARTRCAVSPRTSPSASEAKRRCGRPRSP